MLGSMLGMLRWVLLRMLSAMLRGMLGTMLRNMLWSVGRRSVLWLMRDVLLLRVRRSMGRRVGTRRRAFPSSRLCGRRSRGLLLLGRWSLGLLSMRLHRRDGMVLLPMLLLLLLMRVLWLRSRGWLCGVRTIIGRLVAPRYIRLLLLLLLRRRRGRLLLLLVACQMQHASSPPRSRTKMYSKKRNRSDREVGAMDEKGGTYELAGGRKSRLHTKPRVAVRRLWFRGRRVLVSDPRATTWGSRAAASRHAGGSTSTDKKGVGNGGLGFGWREPGRIP
ncbi:hypothetical protein L209DRAFT_269781 [Thermothelomyces heterothallicus CBS 203.75]